MLIKPILYANTEQKIFIRKQASIENLFYSSIDNASEAVLRTYERYYRVWTLSLNLLHQQNEYVEKDFLDMLFRWKSRLLSRAKALNIELMFEIESLC